MPVEVQVEDYRDAIVRSPELPTLLLENDGETGALLPGMPLDVNWPVYDRLAQANALLCLTARDDGRLVGYLIYVMSESLHHAGTRVAEADVLWLKPAYRRGTLAFRLMALAERELAAHAVDVIYVKASVRKDVGGLYRRHGFEAIETVYRKDLRHHGS